MPREIPKPYPQPGPRPAPQPKPEAGCPLPPPPPRPRPQSDYTDLKIKTLADNIAKTYVPYALKDTESIEEITVDDLTNSTYIYVDQDGKPSKLVFTTVIHKKVEWDDLSEEVQEQILQNHLTPGAHITISPDGVISAEIGVETINGQTGNVVLTADDVNAYTKEVACTKQELIDAINDIEGDGGRIQ